MLFRKPTAGWMLVGLGNPGLKYERTRHNVGFRAIDLLCSQRGCRADRLRLKALTGFCELGGQKVLLVKPMTYMNLSGQAVRPLADYYKIPPEHILVIFDDVSLPVGKLRVRPDGSAGGHNGAREVYACASHGVLSGSAFERIQASPLKEVMLLNTIPLPEHCKGGKIRQLDVSPLFAKAITRIYNETPISSLF